jgi:dipeptidase E
MPRVETRTRRPQIVAMGGGGFLMEPENPLLDDYVLSLVRRRPRVLFVPTASGDAPSFLERFATAFPRTRARASVLSLFRRDGRDLATTVLAQDVVYVGGGNTANQLVVWRLHGLDRILRKAWRAGVVLCGVSAGALCWFECGTTDSFSPALSPLDDGLALLPGSFSPHYDGEARRRPLHRGAVASGVLPSGYAADDGAALHFVGRRLHAVVASRPNARGWRIERRGRRVVETALATRFLGTPYLRS